jgi:hypothetical protein
MVRRAVEISHGDENPGKSGWDKEGRWNRGAGVRTESRSRREHEQPAKENGSETRIRRKTLPT